jgi:hypothetical protein
VLVLTMLALIRVNDPEYEAIWRRHIVAIDKATALFQQDQYPPETLHRLFPVGGLEPNIRRLKRLGLGPFRVVLCR